MGILRNPKLTRKQYMKNIKLKLLITFLIIGGSMSSGAQNLTITSKNFAGANTTFASSAKILVAMTLAKNADLRFGTIMVTSDASETVTINPKDDPTDGLLSFSSGVDAGTDDTYDEAASAASFTVTGSPSNTYGVMLASSDIVVTNTQGALTSTTMTISNLKISFNDAAAVGITGGTAVISTMGASLNSTRTGTSTFKIGGTLTLAAFQAGGTYTNSSTNIFVDYN
jgi:hypothetical protein